METLVSNQHEDDYYHDPSEHGFLWSVLSECLHIIVFGYTLHGMIQFKVKFIHKQGLVRIASMFLIAHSWYLAVKFFCIALVLYLFNDELEARSIPWSDYNCSMLNHAQVFRSHHRTHPQLDFGSNRAPGNLSTPTDFGSVSQRLKYLSEFLRLELDYPLLYARFLHTYGGPFKWLGNRSTLMYGVYSIAIFVMLAIFPIELMYLHEVDFNYIRFVLGDPSCMSELYSNRKRHMGRLASWSRNQTDSELTLGTKIALNRRDLRTFYADDCNHLAVQLVVANMPASRLSARRPTSNEPRRRRHRRRDARSTCANEAADSSRQQLLVERPRFANAELKLTANLRSLRNRFMSINHQDRPGYSVQVAWKNLQKFKPFVRSEIWFKSAMILYPTAIFFYFALLMAIVLAITVFFESSLAEIACNGSANSTGAPLLANWSPLDYLTYAENQYVVYAISCASSFYCSYYFGTVTELHVWTKELAQQLDLSKIVTELNELNNSIDYYNYLVEQHKITAGRGQLLSNLRTIEGLIEARADEANTAKQQYYWRKTSARRRRADEKRSYWFIHCVNDFGGFDCFLAHLTVIGIASQSRKFRLYEQMAFKLLTKKQTLLRATYINMCLFLDELNETKFMTQTILARTTLMSVIFALIVSITRSQFKANVWLLTALLASCLVILNFYLVYAAIINSSVNRLLVKIHSLVSASLRASSEDADLFEYWVRHIRSFGEDRDVICYKIYGYKITWATILNFDSAVCTAYFYSIY